MKNAEVADLGGGCFWGIEEAFRTRPGVIKTEVGYEGGRTDNPTYTQVISHTTGHVETVQITFDPTKISYEDILMIFFGSHNPTTPNQDGPNIGDNYRSVIFYHGEVQKKAAETVIEKISHMYPMPIVTQLEPATTFWPAEDYHQQFLNKHGLGSCHI